MKDIWGYRMDNDKWKKDGLCAAWGARMIKDKSSGNWEGVMGRKTLFGASEYWEQSLVDLINDYKIVSLVSDWLKNNSHRLKNLEPYSIWEGAPISAIVMPVGGYIYLRVGIFSPCKLGDRDWPSIGTSVSVRTSKGWKAGKVLTYIQDGDWVYGIVQRDKVEVGHTEPWEFLSNFMNDSEFKVLEDCKNG